MTIGRGICWSKCFEQHNKFKSVAYDQEYYVYTIIWMEEIHSMNMIIIPLCFAHIVAKNRITYHYHYHCLSFITRLWFLSLFNSSVGWNATLKKSEDVIGNTWMNWIFADIISSFKLKRYSMMAEMIIAYKLLQLHDVMNLYNVSYEFPIEFIIMRLFCCICN